MGCHTAGLDKLKVTYRNVCIESISALTGIPKSRLERMDAAQFEKSATDSVMRIPVQAPETASDEDVARFVEAMAAGLSAVVLENAPRTK